MLGENFYIQITGFNQPLQAGAGGDKTFTAGEVISGSTDSVTLSSTALGVSGNTIQAGEAAKIQFFTGNPFGYLDKSDYQYVSDFYLKFDGYETERDDLVIVLELANSVDTTNTTTRALYVDQGDAFENDDYANLVGTQYEGLVTNTPMDGSPSFLDNNDALVIIESNDYNISPGESWLIKTVQVLSSDDGITGNAINLNRNVDGGGGGDALSASSYDSDPITGLIGPGNTIAEDTSTNPLKIIDAGFTSAETAPPSLDLKLSFAIVDADGDSTATQSIDFGYGVSSLAADASASNLQGDSFVAPEAYQLGSLTPPSLV